MKWGYKVANPSEYLVITGFGIRDVKLAKKAWILPGQTCNVIDVSPVNYTFQVQAMSAEKLPFVLPAVFTIGPRIEDQESLFKYAKLLSSHEKLSNHMTELVEGIIEGETRVLAASMTMEQVFKGTKEFKREVFDKIQLELNSFGLLIYNANVKQLVDVPGHEYFSYLGQKIQMEAANQAKVDVAEAQMKGNTGFKEREGRTSQNAAKVEAETEENRIRVRTQLKKFEKEKEAELKTFEREREADVARADMELTKKKAVWARESELAQVEARKAVAHREAELQMQVEMKNALQQTEKLKAEFLCKACVEYETKVKEADWELYKKQKAAEAALYLQDKEAEGIKTLADAALHKKLKEAEGIKAFAEAIGENNTTYMLLRDYMMIQGGMFQDIARINAGAIQGLQPKISIWTTNGEEDGAMKQVSGVCKAMPPLFSTINEQTGMQPPAMMFSLPTALQGAKDVGTVMISNAQEIN